VADAEEQVGEIRQITEVQAPVLAEEERDATDGGAVVADRVVVAG
jgi:hypothetical protein